MQRGQSILRHPIPPGLGQNATEVGARLNGVPPTRAGVRRSSISQPTAWLAIPKGCLAPGPKRLPLNGFSSQESSRQNSQPVKGVFLWRSRL